MLPLSSFVLDKEDEMRITEYVVSKLAEKFKEHYLQFVIVDLIQIVKNTVIGTDCYNKFVYGYLNGVTASCLEYCLAKYVLDMDIVNFVEKYADCVSETFETINDIITSERFNNTLNNFIEFEIKKYGLEQDAFVSKQLNYQDE